MACEFTYCRADFHFGLDLPVIRVLMLVSIYSETKQFGHDKKEFGRGQDFLFIGTGPVHTRVGLEIVLCR